MALNRTSQNAFMIRSRLGVLGIITDDPNRWGTSIDYTTELHTTDPQGSKDSAQPCSSSPACSTPLCTLSPHQPMNLRVLQQHNRLTVHNLATLDHRPCLIKRHFQHLNRLALVL